MSDPTTQYYYPAISNLITIDDLPSILNFVQSELQDLFSKIYFKNCQITNSSNSDSAFASLDIVSRNKISVELTGTGIMLVLNPDYSDDTISSFPLTIFWQWDIIRFIAYFSATGFSFSVNDMFNLALNIFDVDEEQALGIATSDFIIQTDAFDSKFQKLISDINQFLNTSITIEDTDPNKYQELIEQIEATNADVFATVYSIYILDNDIQTTINNVDRFFSSFIPTDVESYIKLLIIPKARATLELTAALEFPRSVLLPMVHNPDGTYSPDNSTDSSGNLKTTYIQFGDAILDLDTDTGFSYQTDFAGTLYPQYAQIASTCLIISFTDVKLDLSTTSNIPEVDAAGYPPSFVGAYIQQASVIINSLGTDDTTHQSVTLSVSNFIVGTGGISGKISISETGGIIYRNFGQFSAELDTFSVTLLQNTITNCSISGKLYLPGGFNDDGTPSTILINVNIKDAGDFSITAKIVGELPKYTLPNVFTATLRTLTVGEKNGRFYVTVAGTLDFIANIPGLGQVLPKGIIITKLIIYDDGTLEFDGGGIVLPQSFKFSVGPVNLEVSRLSLSTYSRPQADGTTRQYIYFGFDGMVNAGAAGISATGNGIKFYFTHDNQPFDCFLSIDGIGISITEPGGVSPEDSTYYMSGYLSMKNPDPSISGSTAGTEYTGKVAFGMPPLGLKGSATMRLNPSVPAYIVDAGLSLATPIPLGGTGLGIYGFRGLIGLHYVPSKSATTPPLPDTASWWDYYKAKSTITHAEGIELDKFADESGFSIGAGISIATDVGDSGYLFSSKLFLLLGLPDVFLIQGQATIISSRIGLATTTDPPFSALIAFSSQSIIGELDVNFKLPGKGGSAGFITSLQAQLGLGFYFNNSGAWYINIGKDTPASAQVHYYKRCRKRYGAKCKLLRPALRIIQKRGLHKRSRRSI